MTNCILKSVKRKNKLYKTFLKNPSRKNEKTYKRYKNKLNHIIQLSKRLYYEEQLIRYKNNSKMIWKTLNNVLNRKQKTKELPREFIMEDSSKKIIDPNEIANTFNEYFINIGPKVASKIKNTTNATFNNYMENKNMNTMFFDPITETELENEIRNMNPNKCPGYDGISIKTIILCAKEISKPLTHIYNSTFVTGIIPDKLKISLVTPIFKANESNKFGNYRPISVLSCLSKLLEKLTYKRFIEFIETHKILSRHQYGFRKNRSTEHALIELVDKITTAIDEGKYTIGIFLDLSKAFDTINHQILINKLEHYGIRGTCQKWFKNYLSNRKQIVKYNQTKSEEMTIKSGVPQGSILGPLLFLLYINDIQNCSKLISIILFADDTTISYSHKCLKTLNKTIQLELDKISNWLNVNKLSINISKTKFIVFRSSKKNQNYDTTILLNNENIEQAKTTTFLGVIIDEHLTWSHHLDMIHKKIMKSTAIISKSRHYINMNARKLLYYALVYPYLIYCNLIWGNTYKTRIQKLVSIQKKIMRLITFNSYFEHTEPIFRDLEILSIEQINCYLTSIFMFRYNHSENLPEIFNNYFTANYEIHDHNTRSASQIHTTFKRTNYAKHTLAHKGTNVWNVLLNKYKNIKSYTSFKTCIKKYLLSNENEMQIALI